jgi:hypothetical protein
MATYVNNLRLKEITTGDESGTWGTSTNTNLELIGQALGYGTEAITTNADTHATTIADGVADEGRALFLKYTGTLDSACTITLGPNTVKKVWIIENATSGSQNIIISQGSGANITIAPGKNATIYTDGAGASAAVFDAFADLELSSTLSVAGASTLTGAVTATGGVVGNLTGDITGTAPAGTLTGATLASNVLASSLTSVGTLTSLVATTADINGGTVDGATVGASSASSGAFTTLAASSTLAVTGASTLTGNVGVGGAVGAGVGLYLRSSAMTGTTQYGAFFNPTASSAATNALYGVVVTPATAAASFTAGAVTGVRISNATKGAGSTITTQYGLYIEDQTQGGTNWAIYTAGTAPVSFGGTLAVTGALTTDFVDHQEAIAFTANGTASTGRIYKSAVNGLAQNGITGSTYDWAVLSASGAVVFGMDTGSSNVTMAAGNLTLSSALAVTGASTLQGLTVGSASATGGEGRVTLDSDGTVGNMATLTMKKAGSTVGIIAPSGAILGTTADDFAIFAETGNSVYLWGGGQATNGVKIDGTSTTVTGDVGIGTASPQRSLHVNGGGVRLAYSGTDGGLIEGSTTANVIQAYLSLGASYQVGSAQDIGLGIPSGASASRYIYVQNRTAGVYLADGGTSWTSNSDERAKDIIEPITDAANKVSSLRAVIGKYKTDAEGTRRSFLIAQDVQAVLPEAVDTTNPDNLGIQYTEIMPLLVASIKELSARLAALEAK